MTETRQYIVANRTVVTLHIPDPASRFCIVTTADISEMAYLMTGGSDNAFYTAMDADSTALEVAAAQALLKYYRNRAVSVRDKLDLDLRCERIPAPFISYREAFQFVTNLDTLIAKCDIAL